MKFHLYMSVIANTPTFIKTEYRQSMSIDTAKGFMPNDHKQVCIMQTEALSVVNKIIKK